MTKWSGSTICDICKRPAGSVSDKPWFVDGRTDQGPWALMCPVCFEIFGVGLGLGKGQKYDAKTREKIEG